MKLNQAAGSLVMKPFREVQKPLSWEFSNETGRKFSKETSREFGIETSQEFGIKSNQ